MEGAAVALEPVAVVEEAAARPCVLQWQTEGEEIARPKQGGGTRVRNRPSRIFTQGSRVMATFYQDNSLYPAVVRGAIERAGVSIYLVEFIGYEEDGVQETLADDLKGVGCEEEEGEEGGEGEREGDGGRECEKMKADEPPICTHLSRALSLSARSTFFPSSPRMLGNVDKSGSGGMTVSGEEALTHRVDTSGHSYECRRRQLCEYEAMEAMYGLDDSFVSHDADVFAMLKQLVESIEDKPDKHPEIDMRLALSFSIHKKGRGVSTVAYSVRFTLPPLYPIEPSAARIELQPCTRADREYLNGVMGQYSRSLAGEESAMQLLEKAEQLVLEVWEERQGATLADEAVRAAVRAAEAEAAQLQRTLNNKVLGRRVIYFHHIIADSKRQAVMQWAVQLRLGGFAKIGWPGVVVVEGPEACCREFVRCLQRLRWQQMAVRGEQVEQCPPGMCVDDLRRLHHGFEELDTDGMSVLAKACRDAGLEQLFLTCMKIYRDDSGYEEGKGGGGAGGGGGGGRGGGEGKGGPPKGGPPGASRKKNKNVRGAS